jgi:hypothetical protein
VITSLLISILVVVCLNLILLGLLVLGVGRLRDDFGFWQHYLVRIERFTNPNKGRDL